MRAFAVVFTVALLSTAVSGRTEVIESSQLPESEQMDIAIDYVLASFARILKDSTAPFSGADDTEDSSEDDLKHARFVVEVQKDELASLKALQLSKKDAAEREALQPRIDMAAHAHHNAVVAAKLLYPKVYGMFSTQHIHSYYDAWPSHYRLVASVTHSRSTVTIMHPTFAQIAYLLQRIVLFFVTIVLEFTGSTLMSFFGSMAILHQYSSSLVFAIGVYFYFFEEILSFHVCVNLFCSIWVALCTLLI